MKQIATSCFGLLARTAAEIRQIFALPFLDVFSVTVHFGLLLELLERNLYLCPIHGSFPGLHFTESEE